MTTILSCYHRITAHVMHKTVGHPPNFKKYMNEFRKLEKYTICSYDYSKQPVEYCGIHKSFTIRFF